MRKDYPNMQGERNVFGKNTRFYLGIINIGWVIRKFLVPIHSKFSPKKGYEHSKCFFVFSAKITHRSYCISTYYCLQQRRDRKTTSNSKHQTNRWKWYRCWHVFGSCPVLNKAGSPTAWLTIAVALISSVSQMPRYYLQLDNKLVPHTFQFVIINNDRQWTEWKIIRKQNFHSVIAYCN
jgi:hypothetical protein